MKFLDATKIPDHPYPELRQVLHAFVNEVSAALGENLVGIYLVGSIASGDFDLDSDVDFLVVSNTELNEANMRLLQDIQIKIHDMDYYPSKHLEGSYISIGDLNNWSTVGKRNSITSTTVAPLMMNQPTTTNGMFVGFCASVEYLWLVQNPKPLCNPSPEMNYLTK